MEIIKIDLKNPKKEEISKIAEALEKNLIVILPTDTCYGLIANASKERIVEKVFEIKRREPSEPISIIVRDLKMAEEVAELDRQDQKIFHHFLPGPLTLVVEAQKGALPKALLGGGETVGLRLPRLKLIKKLMHRLNFPITATSANLSGKEDPYTADEVVKQYKGKEIKPDLIVDGGELPEVKPSTVLDATGEELKVLRGGPVSLREIEKIL